MKRPVIFLDRDGTIIEDKHYLASIQEIEWIKGAPEAIRDLYETGFRIIVITNQSGVARGLIPEARVGEIHCHLNHYLASLGAKIHSFFYCPHHPEAGAPPYRMKCDCRKPGPGLIMQAMNAFDIDIHGSFLIGDKISDVEAGLNAGIAPILVLTGKGKEQEKLLARDTRLRDVVRVFPSIGHAAQWIISRRKAGDTTPLR